MLNYYLIVVFIVVLMFFSLVIFVPVFILLVDRIDGEGRLIWLKHVQVGDLILLILVISHSLLHLDYSISDKFLEIS